MPRGFDALTNPAGAAIVGASILLFAIACYVGARMVRDVSRRGEEMRRQAREERQDAP